MTNEQLIAKFNPANGANVSGEDLEILHALTDEQIDILADAYPNTPAKRSYLRLYDKNLKPDKQLYQLSTWQNLRNVRKFSNKKNLIAWDFNATAKNAVAPVKNLVAKASASSPKKVVVDLTAKEAAEELKKSVAAGKVKAEGGAGPAKTKTPAAKSSKLAAVKEEKVVDESKPDDQNFEGAVE